MINPLYLLRPSLHSHPDAWRFVAFLMENVPDIHLHLGGDSEWMWGIDIPPEEEWDAAAAAYTQYLGEEVLAKFPPKIRDLYTEQSGCDTIEWHNFLPWCEKRKIPYDTAASIMRFSDAISIAAELKKKFSFLPLMSIENFVERHWMGPADSLEQYEILLGNSDMASDRETVEEGDYHYYNRN